MRYNTEFKTYAKVVKKNNGRPGIEWNEGE